jgi:hypothetical protein
MREIYTRITYDKGLLFAFREQDEIIDCDFFKFEYKMSCKSDPAVGYSFNYDTVQDISLFVGWDMQVTIAFY